MADSALSPPMAPPNFDQTFGAFSKAAEEERKAAEEQRTSAKRIKTIQIEAEPKLKESRERVERAIDQPVPGKPTIEEAPPPPSPREYQKMSMEFLGAMTLLGAFAGKRVRNAGNASLKAFSAAMNGWQDGNLQAYKQATEEWKQRQEQLLALNRQKMEAYRLNLEDKRLSIDEQLARHKMIATEYEDRIAWDRANAGDFNGVAKAYQAAANATEKAEASTQALVGTITAEDAQATERANQWQKYLATPQGDAYFKQQFPNEADQFRIKGFIHLYADQPIPTPSPTFQGPPGRGDVNVEPPPGTVTDTATTPEPQSSKPMPINWPRLQALGWSREAIQDAATRLRETGQQPMIPGRGAERTMIMGAIQSIASEQRRAEGGTVKDDILNWQITKMHQLGMNRFIGGGDQSKQLASVNMVVQHMKVLEELNDAWKRGDLETARTIGARWARYWGQSEPTNVDMAAQVVGTELVRALGVAGGGAEADRRGFTEKFVSTASAKQVFDAVNDVGKPLLIGRVEALRHQFEQATGLPIEKFDQLLMPETLGILRRTEAGGGQSKPQTVIQNGHTYELQPDGSYK